MRFAHFFVDRPIFASVTSIVLLILGYVAYSTLPVAQYPEIVPPTVVVRASYPGANAETVAATIATPIEQEINGVDNMLYMSSLSTNDGSMQLTVTFKLGTDLDVANVLVQNRLSVAQPRLPVEVRNLGVTVRKASPDLMTVVHILSPKHTYDQNYLSNYIYLNLRDQLLRLDGVGDITVFGGGEYALRIWLDPNKMAAYSLSASDIIAALQEQNVQVASGALGAAPAPASNAFQLVVQTKGRLKTIDEFERVIVKAADGRLVRIGNVARVELGQKDYSTQSFLNSEPAIGIGVFQRPGTNALQAAQSVRNLMEKAKKDFPADVEYRIAYNPTEFISQSVDEVYVTLFEAVILVIIVVLVFLQSWRTALIPVIAIPVSLVGTFAVMKLLGFSLNNLTLFGLVLAIGIVVDDAIVVVENVERNIEEGLSPGDAAHKTMDEVGGAVIAIALVLSAVFIPTAFIPGISGQFYRQFALTIAASTIISMFNSLTLSPALCKLLLKPQHERATPRFFVARGLRWGADRFNRGFEAMSHGYSRAVGVLTGGVVGLGAMVLVYAAVIGGVVYLTRTTPTGFIPLQDQGYLITIVQLPAGSALERTTAVAREVGKRALGVNGAADAVIISGFDGATFTNSSNGAAIFVILKPHKERAATGRTANAILADILKATSFDRGGADHRRAAAAGARPRQRGRLQDAGAEPPEFRDRTAARNHRRPHRPSQRRSKTVARLHDLRQRHAAALSRHRPHQGAHARRAAHQRLLDAAEQSRRQLHQRLQHIRPHLSGADAVRRAVPARAVGHRAAEGALVHRRARVDGVARRRAEHHRPADRAALQPVLFRARAGRHEAGRLDG